MDTLVSFMPWLGVLLALLFTALALHNNSRKRLLLSLPTSRTNGVFVGLVELSGTAESESPLTSHLAEVPCVHYEWKVDEEWRRTTVSTDHNGKTTTRHEQGWTTVASGTETQSFYLKDATGVVLVNPKGAKLDAASVFDRTCGPTDPLYYAKGPMESVSSSTQQRHYTEQAFALHEQVFIVGKARERRDAVAAEIAQDRSAELFVISSKGEEKIVSGYRWAAILLSVLGIILLLGVLVWWDTVQHRNWQSRRWVYACAALAYAVTWTAGWIWSVYNGLITLRNRVQQGLSLVDVQLQRRHDLIPNLMRVLDAFKGHEQNLQVEVVALRRQASATLPGQPGPDPKALRPTLAGLQEALPQLKADRAFLDLQKEIISTENRIALARDYFNSIATHYNTSLEQFPDSVVATLAMLKAQPLLEAPEFERAAVQVQLAS